MMMSWRYPLTSAHAHIASRESTPASCAAYANTMTRYNAATGRTTIVGRRTAMSAAPQAMSAAACQRPGKSCEETTRVSTQLAAMTLTMGHKRGVR